MALDLGQITRRLNTYKTATYEQAQTLLTPAARAIEAAVQAGASRPGQNTRTKVQQLVSDQQGKIDAGIWQEGGGMEYPDLAGLKTAITRAFIEANAVGEGEQYAEQISGLSVFAGDVASSAKEAAAAAGTAVKEAAGWALPLIGLGLAGGLLILFVSLGSKRG